MLGTYRRFIVDGKSYRSPAEMPADVRERYERALQIERSGAIPGDAKVTFQMNGKEYSSVAELPLPWRWFATGLMALARRRVMQAATPRTDGNLPESPASSVPTSGWVSFLKFLLTLAIVFALLYWYQMRR
jgi:hypothetical protein